MLSIKLKKHYLLLMLITIQALYSDIPFIEATFFIDEQDREDWNKISTSFLNKTLPEWMLANIQRETSQFPPFSVKELELYFLNTPTTERLLLHFKIRNNTLYVRSNDGSRPHPMAEYTTALYKILKQPGCTLANGDFLLVVADGVGDFICKYPIWCFSKHQSSNSILVPDVFAVGKERLQVLNEVDRASNLIPWEQKTNQAFWIGAANGGKFDDKRLWKDNRRAQLVLFSLANPDILWARFTHIKNEAHICPEMKALDSLLCSDRIPPPEGCKHKYLIDVDGFASAYHRCQWILRSNCVSIKETSGNIQWYYSGLIPYVHYVPYQTNCSDLKNVIYWLREHDRTAKNIAQQSQRFAMQYLDTDTTYLYLYHVMQETVKLIVDFTPQNNP